MRHSTFHAVHLMPSVCNGWYPIKPENLATISLWSTDTRVPGKKSSAVPDFFLVIFALGPVFEHVGKTALLPTCFEKYRRYFFNTLIAAQGAFPGCLHGKFGIGWMACSS